LKKAFSIIELIVAIILLGIMATLSINYYNTSTISKQSIKSQLQSHLEIITATVLQCKELSGIMPLQDDGSLADDTDLNTLECNTTTTYKIDGQRGGFIPKPLKDFTTYKATQTDNEFYFKTTTPLGSYNDDVLVELNSTYSSSQYELSDDGNDRTMKFYLSH